MAINRPHPDYNLDNCYFCGKHNLELDDRVHIKAGELFGSQIRCCVCGCRGPLAQPLLYLGSTWVDKESTAWFIAWLWNGGWKLDKKALDKAYNKAFPLKEEKDEDNI